MYYKNVCNELQEGWETLNPKWIAEVKNQYYSKLFAPLYSEADGVYRRNSALEDYAQQCTRRLGVEREEYV